MQKIIATLIALTMTSLAVPIGSANSTTEPYIAAGTSLGTGLTPPFLVSTGVKLQVSGAYGTVSVEASDLASPHYHPPLAVCLWNLSSTQSLCDVDGYASDVQCDPVRVSDAPFLSDTAYVWVYTYAILPDLNVCSGTTGTVTGIFS